MEQEQIIETDIDTENSDVETVEETEETEETEEVVKVDVEHEEDDDTSHEKESDNETKDEKPKKQTAGERKAQAEARRKREAKEREEAEQSAYKKGVIKGLGGINPYTNEEIVDNIDFELYEEMVKAEEKGFDPTDAKELNAYRKTVKQEQAKANEEAKKKDENIAKDIKIFTESNPDVDVTELLSNPDFKDFAEDLIGTISLNKIYEKYSKFNENAKKTAKEIAIRKEARKIASTGSLNGSDGEGDLYTAEELSKLTREEIDSNYEKVQRSKEKHYYKR